jgi:hypothetical protein
LIKLLPLKTVRGSNPLSDSSCFEEGTSLGFAVAAASAKSLM